MVRRSSEADGGLADASAARPARGLMLQAAAAGGATRTCGARDGRELPSRPQVALYLGGVLDEGEGPQAPPAVLAE